MGDALRNTIGISATWTKEEIRLYSQIAPEKLGPVYAVENIQKDEPANRARYWDRRLRIDDNGRVEKRILNICQKYNKAVALINLEQIVIKKFF